MATSGRVVGPSDVSRSSGAPEVAGAGDGGRAIDPRVAAHQQTIDEVKSFLSRVLNQNLGDRTPTLEAGMGERGSISVTGDVNVDPVQAVIKINPKLFEDQSEEGAFRLKVQIAMGTATYYLHSMLASSSLPEALRKGKDKQDIGESVVATHAFARLVAVTYRRHDIPEGYANHHDFLREIFWYTDRTDRQLAQMLHTTFIEIQTGEKFHYRVMGLIAPDYHPVEVIRLSRQVAMIEYLKHGCDPEAAIRGLYRRGSNAIEGITRTDRNTIHPAIDGLLKTQEEGRITHIYVPRHKERAKTIGVGDAAQEDGDEAVKLTLEIVLSPGSEPRIFDIRKEDVEGYMSLKATREAASDMALNDAKNAAFLESRRQTPEDEHGEAVRDHLEHEFTSAVQLRAKESKVVLVEGLEGSNAVIDPIAADCAYIFAALEPTTPADSLRSVRDALAVFFDAKGTERVVPANSLVDIGGHDLMHRADDLLEHKYIEVIQAVDPATKGTVPYYHLTSKGRGIAKEEGLKEGVISRNKSPGMSLDEFADKPKDQGEAQ